MIQITGPDNLLIPKYIFCQMNLATCDTYVH